MGNNIAKIQNFHSFGGCKPTPLSLSRWNFASLPNFTLICAMCRPKNRPVSNNNTCRYALRASCSNNKKMMISRTVVTLSRWNWVSVTMICHYCCWKFLHFRCFLPQFCLQPANLPFFSNWCLWSLCNKCDLIPRIASSYTVVSVSL